ncbi:MAG TPA: hypothetical protein VGI93_17785, partial [Steroidobacteraceae bacterium]
IISIKEALEETDAIRFKTPKSAAGVRDIAMPDIVAETLRTLIRQEQEGRLALGLGRDLCAERHGLRALFLIPWLGLWNRGEHDAASDRSRNTCIWKF